MCGRPEADEAAPLPAAAALSQALKSPRGGSPASARAVAAAVAAKPPDFAALVRLLEASSGVSPSRPAFDAGRWNAEDASLAAAALEGCTCNAHDYEAQSRAGAAGAVAALVAAAEGAVAAAGEATKAATAAAAAAKKGAPTAAAAPADASAPDDSPFPPSPAAAAGVCACALLALANLARDDGNQGRAEEAGAGAAVPAAMRALAPHHPAVALAGAKALANLARHDGLRGALVACGAVEASVAVLSRGGRWADAPPAEFACRSLVNLVADSAAGAARLAAAGGLEALVGAMRAFPAAEAVQLHASWALLNAAGAAGVSTRIGAANNGGGRRTGGGGGGGQKARVARAVRAGAPQALRDALARFPAPSPVADLATAAAEKLGGGGGGGAAAR